MEQRFLEAVVLARRRLTDHIAEFRIGRADGRALPMAEAGSHVELRFRGADGVFMRHYSVVGPLEKEAAGEPFWRVAVQRENRARGSDFIHRMFHPGARLRASRPINAFRLGRNRSPTLLVAGGIGITALYPMARSLRIRKEGFSFFYAGRERAAMAYADELATLCAGRLTLHESVRHGIPDLRALLEAQPDGTRVYVCGPGPMIDAVRGAGEALGWARERVRFEAFNAAHRPTDTAFDVRLRSGRTVSVGAGTAILDALENAGVDTLSHCRRGECGLCTAEVVGCDGRLDHRDRFLTEDEHGSGRQITLCCSRIEGRLLELDI